MLQRVQKIISNAGYCSRRKAEELIKKGHVRVNGKRITIGDKADPNKDKITAEGNNILANKKVYIAFHKPRDILTTLYDPSDKETILKYLIDVKKRIFPVGRLDKDTKGLLVITNDGRLFRRLTEPGENLEKGYLVEVEKQASKADVKKLEAGLEIELDYGLYKTRPAKAELLNPKKLRIFIREGKKRQVRRMLEALNNRVLVLRRESIGCLRLADLKIREGQFKEFKFRDFQGALDFTNRVGSLAESQGHHPDIYLTWGKVKLTVWTHKIDGLTESDFIFAAKTDQL